MAKRSSIATIEGRWLQTAGERIAFIPDLRILELATPRECLDMFIKDWGEADQPPAIALPLVGAAGVAFDNLLCQRLDVLVKTNHNQATPKNLGQICRDFVDLGSEVYLYVCPSMEFLQVEACHVVDIRNIGSPKACVNKEKTREFLGYFLGKGLDHITEHLEGLEEKLKGVVIDLTDLWGMGGDDEKLYLTCFCEECRSYFNGKGINLTDFETSPSPWNLALKNSGTGISYIDNLSRGEVAASIVGKSALRGFDSDFSTDQDKAKAATALMDYMVARHEMVEDFLTAAFAEATLQTVGGESRSLKKIGIVEGVEYDWTAGVFPSSLSAEVVDELWIDPSDKVPTIKAPHKMFMWRRASYFLVAFFQSLSNAANTRMRTTTRLAHFSEDQIVDLLRTRAAQAINNELRGPSQLAALPILSPSGRNGFVGVVLSQDILDGLLRNPKIAQGLAETAGPNQKEKLLRQLLSLRSAFGSTPGKDD